MGLDQYVTRINPNNPKDEEEKLRDAVISDSLPDTTGFFFGFSGNKYQEQDRRFVAYALSSFLVDEKLFYTSWW